MQTRDQEIIDQLTELCRVNEFAHFDISITAEKGENEGYLIFEKTKYTLAELNLTVYEIEWLERIDQLGKVHVFRFKQLKPDEIFRTTYSLFPAKTIEYHTPLPDEYKWSPLSIIALIGGFTACIFAIIMAHNRINIVGYDTYHGGGYGYQTLTPGAVLFLGIFILFIGVKSMPRKKK